MGSKTKGIGNLGKSLAREDVAKETSQYRTNKWARKQKQTPTLKPLTNNSFQRPRRTVEPNNHGNMKVKYDTKWMNQKRGCGPTGGLCAEKPLTRNKSYSGGA